MRLTCSVYPKSPNSMPRHWGPRSRLARQIREALWAENPCLRGNEVAKHRPKPPVAIHLHLLYAKHPRDRDNLLMSAKMIIDQLKSPPHNEQGLCVIEDDSPSIVLDVTASQEKVKTVAEQGFELLIESAR